MSLPLPTTGNKFISALPPKIQKIVLQECDTVDICFGEILNETDQVLRFAYFPTSGYISLLMKLEGHEPLELGMIGDEGMLGAAQSVRIDKMAMQSVVQGSGQSLRMSGVTLRRLTSTHPALNQLLTRYTYVLMDQLMQSAACTYFHSIEQRLARWLLMSHDRVRENTLQLTHEFLANMLGVRRSGVTIAALNLQNQKLINYSRGKIMILDPKGLENASCECYQKMNLAYTNNFPK